MIFREYQSSDEPAVIALWQACSLLRPWNDPLRDIERKLSDRNGRFLVAELEERIVASMMVGYDGHRGSINYLAVSPELQGQGHGRAMMEYAEHLLKELGCPKINLQVRVDNESVLKFYNAIGYQADTVVSLGKRLILDD